MRRLPGRACATDAPLWSVEGEWLQCRGRHGAESEVSRRGKNRQTQSQSAGHQPSPPRKATPGMSPLGSEEHQQGLSRRARRCRFCIFQPSSLTEKLSHPTTLQGSVQPKIRLQKDLTGTPEPHPCHHSWRAPGGFGPQEEPIWTPEILGHSGLWTDPSTVGASTPLPPSRKSTQSHRSIESRALSGEGWGDGGLHQLTPDEAEHGDQRHHPRRS